MRRHRLAGGFCVELTLLGNGTPGRVRVGYRLLDAGVEIFAGDDFSPSTLDGDPDGRRSAISLAGFLSCQPGDVAAEYFAKYTPQQRDWCERRAEALGSVVRQYEQAYEEARKAL